MINSLKKILVTGANKGIGKAIATQLAQEGYQVVLVARSPETSQLVEEIKSKTNNQNIFFLQGDLSSIASCKQLTNKIKTQHNDLNVLINNAGVWMTNKQMNADGFEQSFMVNYIAPFMLCTGLLDTLKMNTPARIVNVNAGLYIKGNFDGAKTPKGEDFHKIKTYANTKFCNVLFSIDFAKKIENSGVTINAVHPGVINTNLGQFGGFLGFILKLIKKLWKTPEYGALAPVWLATDMALEGINGTYFNEKKEMLFDAKALDAEMRKTLWDKTIDWIK
jgi:NAD(P)-dependent dehydrogenase (short-subunit alcohol dehydrogenase family)